MSDYLPREGSVAERVIRFLNEHGASSTSKLVEEMDEGVTRANLPACMSTGIRLAAVFVRKIDGETWYDVKPFVSARDDPAPGGEGGEAAADAAAVAESRDDPAFTAVMKVISRPAAPAAPAMPLDRGERRASGFRCALWSDGSLLLELDGGPITLSAEQTRVLGSYFGRLAPAP